MKLTDGNKHSQEVQCGLVDKSGAFFLLLDSNEIHYYRFSDEAEAITALVKQVKQLETENERLKKRLGKK